MHFEVMFYLFIEFSKLVQQRQLLDGQLNENKSVLDELNILGPDNKVRHLQFSTTSKTRNNK